MMYVHSDFPGRNKKVVCRIYATSVKNLDFLLKMVDLDILQSYVAEKVPNYYQILNEVLYSFEK